jgi:hypothetical protein
MLDLFDTNPTQLIGIFAFGVATISCFFAAICADREKGIWTTLALINLIFLFEIFIGLRHRVPGLHDFAVGMWLDLDDYAPDGRLKTLFLISSVAALLALVAPILVGLRSWQTRIATTLTMAMAAMFMLESLYITSLTKIIYKEVGFVFVIGWIWAAAAVGILLATLN